MLAKRLILYLLLFFFITYLVLISAWINLDSKALTPWVHSYININLPRKYRADIGAVETNFGGLEITQIQIQDLPEDRPIVNIESLTISISCIDFLLFQEIDYAMELYGGSIDGEFDLFPQKAVDFTISDLQINRNAAVRKTNLITSNPIANGEGSYTMGEIPEADLEWVIEDLSVSGNPQYTNIPFELPDTKFSRFEGVADLNGNEVTIQLKSEGDLTAKMEGSIKLNPTRPVKSEFDLNLTGSLTSEFESKLGFFKSILVNYKNATGQVSVNVSGSLQRPRIKKN